MIHLTLFRRSNKLLLLLIAVAGIGCATVAEHSEPLPRASRAEQSVRELLEDREPQLALMYLDSYRVRTAWDYPWQDELELAAAEQLRELFEEAFDSGDHRTAGRLLRGLKLADPDYVDAGEYQLQLARMAFETEYQEERFPLAIAAFLQLLQHDVGQLTDHTALLVQGMELIADQRDAFAYETASERLQQQGLSVADFIDELPVSPRPTADQVPGVATIWVNKGIRLEDGVGRPDRMIGSGFFIDERGYLVTNYHVIQSEVDPAYRGFSRAYIRPHDAPDSRIPAKVVGFDPVLDLALLKVPYTPDYVFPVSGVRERSPGSRVYAIGSPGGLSNTITSGIISAAGRRFFQLGEAVQVDAPLNPGNSGGPILDEDGNLVGVVYAGIPQFDGISFAVPSFWLRGILPQLYEEGRVQHPYLGISVHETHRGLEVVHVILGSPADRAQLTVGDVVTGINGEAVTTLKDANRMLQVAGPDSLVRLSILREGDDGRRQDQQRLVTGSRPQRPLEANLRGTSSFPESLFAPLYGVFLQPVRTGWFSSDYTVERVLPGSIADEAGLSPQDPVTLQRWEYDEDRGIAAVVLRVRKRQSGYMDGAVMLPVFIETTNVL
ncbi:S1C family serine protease [Spirochaeta africana]|uniref:Trypsin-like serine protease with C-terminal PDZ domain n=1 Tax=Spirochaeta africana (strain ATCC 700263 / DSM 8902 / Z-7692) TaxID=889378 RepID=H9UK83_SPIAZ|nr:S1C family serine protease [Spirochaeta africana]AFG37926.1 trypsin-like serine protease with C-terminal PDZ domain [Spirochaeta africana DSM 8902]